MENGGSLGFRAWTAKKKCDIPIGVLFRIGSLPDPLVDPELERDNAEYSGS